MLIYNEFLGAFYSPQNKGMQILLSTTQPGPGRVVQQEQEYISRNHVQTISSVLNCVDPLPNDFMPSSEILMRFPARFTLDYLIGSARHFLDKRVVNVILIPR